MDHIQGEENTYRWSLMDCSLLASGTFLRIEIKSTWPKQPGTTSLLSFRLGLLPQLSRGSFGHHSSWAQGHSGWQPSPPDMPGRWGSPQPCCLPRTLQVKTLIGLLRNVRPNQSVPYRELALSNGWCHISLFGYFNSSPQWSKEENENDKFSLMPKIFLFLLHHEGMTLHNPSKCHLILTL